MSFGQPPGGGGLGPGTHPPGGFGPPGGGPPSFGSPPGGFGAGWGPPDGAARPPGNELDPLAIVSTVIGIFSLITCACCGLLGIPISIAATICGGISIHRQNNEPDRFSSSSKPLAIIGIVLGALTLVLSIVAALAGFGLQLIEQANRL